MGITYKRADTEEELYQILALQRANIPSAISETEKQKEGFVTVHHNYAILKQMNDKCPHVIATYEGKVIGYTLCMASEFKAGIDVLKPMFWHIEKIVSHDVAYIVMGQVCIAKHFRKRGVFRGLYEFMKNELKSEYDQIITEVDRTNVRSLNAHLAIGFKILYSYHANQQDWDILSWDLKHN